MKFPGIFCAVVVLAATSASGFSLLGPYKPWMTDTLSYRLPGDIGGPMFMLERYRWNLPTITYGFDQSFLDYFGEEGVRAVEEAFTILNELPPMSGIDPNAYPTNSKTVNVEAQALEYLDLKSSTLSLLLHQLGLNEPSRFAYALRSRNASATATNYTVIPLNFDPFDFTPTSDVNGVDYGYQLVESPDRVRADALEFLIDPLARGWTAVADRNLAAGEFYTGLTRDDVGGLRFLLRTNTMAVEKLSVPVTLVAPATNGGLAAAHWIIDHPGPITNASIVETAPRAGIDKPSFVRLPWDADAGQFLALTNVFVDTYYTNGQRRQQTLRRVITWPDILFRARDLGVDIRNVPFPPSGSGYSFFPRYTAASDTSRWINHDDINGQTAIGGPGVIPPGATIDFGTVGRYLDLANSLGGSMYQWASFDGSTNEPVAFPGSERATSVTISARLRNDGPNPAFEWTLLGIPDAIYRIETTTDFVNWSTVTTVTNVNGHFAVTDRATTSRRFYRAVRGE